MERRYDLFAGANVRKIETYNQYVENKNQENDAEHQLEKLPYSNYIEVFSITNI